MFHACENLYGTLTSLWSETLASVLGSGLSQTLLGSCGLVWEAVASGRASDWCSEVVACSGELGSQGWLQLVLGSCGFLCVAASCSDEDDDDDDDEDDTAELLAELERIKKERAEEKARKVNYAPVLFPFLCVLMAPQCKSELQRIMMPTAYATSLPPLLPVVCCVLACRRRRVQKKMRSRKRLTLRWGTPLSGPVLPVASP